MSHEINSILNHLHNEQAGKALYEQRYRANMELVETLRAMLMAYPDLRFSQALANFGFVVNDKDAAIWSVKPLIVWTDEYNLEPNTLLDRVRNVINGIHET